MYHNRVLFCQDEDLLDEYGLFKKKAQKNDKVRTCVNVIGSVGYIRRLLVG